MSLGRLQIRNFRNIRDGVLQLSPKENLIVGANGAGKTAVLEAAYFLARGRSFRGSEPRRLITEGEQELAVFGEVRSALGTERRVGIGARGARRSIRVDGKDERSAAAVAELLPISLLVPQSHGILERGPAYRRRLLDWGLFHVEPLYVGEARSYARVLAQRNSALRDGNAGEPSWENLLAARGEVIQRRRSGYVRRLNEALVEVSKGLVGESVSVALESGWGSVKVDLKDALARSRRVDERLGYTTVGPHRGDLVVRVGTREAARFVSQGQQKLVIAAVVLAQARLVQETRQGEMLLLVDDFGAELDRKSRNAFWTEIQSSGCQTIITAIERGDLPNTGALQVFHVEQGTLASR